MKVTIIAGARPNFMKIAPIIRAIRKQQSMGIPIQYRLVHTGQHYDKALSDTFFHELEIPPPDINLGVGSGSQAVQTANIMIRFEEELINNPVDVVVVVGDVNSTLACSVIAKKLNTQLAHVEAGIRSFDLTMPEEINRMVTDALADHFFTTSSFANDNLLKAGIEQSRIHFVGNTMIDTLQANLNKLKKPLLWDTYNLSDKNYFILTLHRPSNVDDLASLENILNHINISAGNLPVVFPAHPRTVNNLKKIKINFQNIITIDPLGYLEFMYLVKNSKAVITDSGGIQEETTVLGIPCITLRKNTERPETIKVGTNELLQDISQLKNLVDKILSGTWKKGKIPELWDGKTSTRIVSKLLEIQTERAKGFSQQTQVL
ncbi:MAG: UDP-N-acetylglucosamine 2-epimerase [Bacteroidetes bacterium RIFCSPLOWO2_02_FULL_36_8]|nr:MAG: UDP-N-acetylglucosamine 2-epimerase [Bacteroidetes bacterium RIFCSPLOWO2_02_FULL_36_8]OFY71001.1 MAG: UDP-N-acetylglucosamine 2-epimerase [Bacteroidetes bacterium RIFCSPLOWO2_12_FULL_37_12]